MERIKPRRPRVRTENDPAANPLARIRHEINRVFETSLHEISSGMEMLRGWNPAVDLIEKNDTIVVQAELPGMRREEIAVSVQGNTLTISGERKREETERGSRQFKLERYHGRFRREILLPQPVEASPATAVYQDGILTLTLPKVPEARRRQIDVQVT